MPHHAMIPIHQLLSRIRWDAAFGRGHFEIGYFDRTEVAIRRIALRDVSFRSDERRVFEATDESGRFRRIPFHRVREVYRDGELIWQRPVAGPQSAA
jgi:uncharacterized protein (UPF0248 family)